MNLPSGLTRRKLLVTTAFIPPALVLSGCGTTTATAPVTTAPTTGTTPATPATPQTAFQKAIAAGTAVASVLSGSVLPVLSTIAGLSAATVTKIQGWVATAETDAASLASAVTTAAGQSPASGFLTVAFNIVGSLAGVSGLPAGIATIIEAVQDVAPLIEAGVGIASVFAAAPPPVPGQTRLQPDTALAVLQGVAASH